MSRDSELDQNLSGDFQKIFSSDLNERRQRSMSDALRYAVWPEPRSRSRSLKGSRPSVPTGLIFYLFFFSDQRREETRGRILTRNGSKGAESRKDVPFWGHKMKNWNMTLFTPKTLQIWPWIGNFQPKWWNMKLQVYQKVLNQSRWKFNTMLGT